MPSSIELVYLLAGVIAGVIVASLVVARRARAAGRTEREPELVALARDNQAARAQCDELRERLGVADSTIVTLRTRIDVLTDERAGLSAQAGRAVALERQLVEVAEDLRVVRGAHATAAGLAAEQAARLEEQQQANLELRERLKLEIQTLAADILEDKSKRFSAQNATQIEQLLGPLRTQIVDFRQLVSNAYEKESGARVALQTEIKQLVDLNRRLSDEAHSLTRALTTENRTQGYWGELKLERLLESAGLEKGQQYLTQESFRDADGDRYRPDAVLLLPDDRHIIIDAKMTLVDYQRGCDATDETEREQHFARHAQAMRTHVRQLGDKDYSRLEGLNSPELVLMFVPVEAAFLEAVRRDAGLYDDAFQKKIILVGPGNLLASLKLVAQIWRTEDQNRNAQLIATKAASLHDKFVGFVEDIGKVGEHLERAHKAQQGALDKLSRGRGNLVRRVDDLRRLGVSPTKQLPQALLDASGADDDIDGGAGNDDGAE